MSAFYDKMEKAFEGLLSEGNDLKQQVIMLCELCGQYVYIPLTMLTDDPEYMVVCKCCKKDADEQRKFDDEM